MRLARVQRQAPVMAAQDSRTLSGIVCCKTLQGNDLRRNIQIAVTAQIVRISQ
jgi:hypothetical protein